MVIKSQSLVSLPRRLNYTFVSRLIISISYRSTAVRIPMFNFNSTVFILAMCVGGRFCYQNITHKLTFNLVSWLGMKFFCIVCCIFPFFLN